LIVKIPLLFKNSSFSLISAVSGATVSSFHGRDLTYKDDKSIEEEQQKKINHLSVKISAQ